MDVDQINRVTRHILDAAYKLHTKFGPGLLERTYEICLAHDLRSRGFTVRTQVGLSIEYMGEFITDAYRVDMIVDDRVMVELKSVRKLLPIHESQMLTYLKLSGFHVGLVINFQEQHLRDGITRLVNDL
jgi:GxxExxY protein